MKMMASGMASRGVARSALGRFVAVALAIAFVLLSGAEAVADSLVLKDGRRFEGKVVRELDRAVLFKVVVGDIEQERWFPRADIAELIIDSDSDDEGSDEAEAGGSEGTETAAKPAGATDMATRVAFVTLGDPFDGSKAMVGTYISARTLREIGDMFREMPEHERPEVIVLDINSGGGYTMETMPLSDAIHEDLKRDFRVVSWIRSAISAAAMTAWNCEEIVLRKEGNIGGATQFAGMTASKGASLAEVLQKAEVFSERGGHNPLVMRAMQIPMDLSADVDEQGNVIWYENLQGEYVLNTEDPDRTDIDQVLTMNSVEAEKFGISIGTADTKDELARVLGLREWREVGQEGERHMIDYREKVFGIEAELQNLWEDYQMLVGLAQGANDRRTRSSYVAQARQKLQRMKRRVNEVPVMELLYNMNDRFFEEQERFLRRLLGG